MQSKHAAIISSGVESTPVDLLILLNGYKLNQFTHNQCVAEGLILYILSGCRTGSFLKGDKILHLRSIQAFFAIQYFICNRL
jgi:hypothetical protein